MTDATTTLARPARLHSHICIDRSGSMQGAEEATVTSVNGWLKEARGDANLKDADIVITIFDTNSIDDIRSGTPTSIADLTLTDFVPRGGTPLLDAIGRCVDRLDARLEAAKSARANLVVVTDGFENASRKHSYESIAAALKARQAAGWLVNFLAEGIDAPKQGVRLGVMQNRVASISKSPITMRRTMSSLRMATSAYAASADTRAHLKADQGFTVEQRRQMGDETGGSWLRDPIDAGPASPKATAVASLHGAGVAADVDVWGDDKACGLD